MTKNKLLKHKYVGFVYDSADRCHPIFANTLKEIQEMLDFEVNRDYEFVDNYVIPWGIIVEAKNTRDIRVKPKVYIEAKIDMEDND